MLDLLLADVTNYTTWRIVGILLSLAISAAILAVTFIAYKKTLKAELAAAETDAPIVEEESKPMAKVDTIETAEPVVAEEKVEVVEPQAVIVEETREESPIEAETQQVVTKEVEGGVVVEVTVGSAANPTTIKVATAKPAGTKSTGSKTGGAKRTGGSGTSKK